MTFTGVTSVIGGTEIFAGGAFTVSVAIAGVTVGMSVAVTPRTFPGNGVYWEGYVDSPGSVTVKVGASIALFVIASIYDVQVNDASGADPQLQLATFSLAASDINGMFAVPIQIVPAQGPGTLIVVTRWTLNALGATPFLGGGALFLYYGFVSPPISQASISIVVAFLTTLPADQVTSAGGPNGGAGGIVPSAIAVNTPVSISNTTAPFTAGGGTVVRGTCQFYVLSGIS